MTTTIDFEAIKTKQQGTWSSGDYAVIGTTLQITGEQLCESVDVSAGQRVLDVAAGNGNASLAAARRGCDVVATDYVGALLDGTAARAASEGRDFVTPDDVKAFAPAVLRHRLILHPDAEIEGTSADDCVEDILREAKVPRTAA